MERKDILCICYDGMSASSAREDCLSHVITEVLGIPVYARRSATLNSRRDRERLTKAITTLSGKVDGLFLVGKSAGAKHLVGWCRENGETLGLFRRWAVLTVDPSSPADILKDLLSRRSRTIQGLKSSDMSGRSINVYQTRHVPRGLLVAGAGNFECHDGSTDHQEIVHSRLVRTTLKVLYMFLIAGETGRNGD